MGYRNWNAYEEANEAEWRRLPLRRRYAWGRLALMLAGAGALALFWLALRG